MWSFRLRPDQSPGILGLKKKPHKNLYQKEALNHISLGHLSTQIEGDNVSPNECQQKSVEMKKKKNPELQSGILFTSLLHWNKMTTQFEIQTIVK